MRHRIDTWACVIIMLIAFALGVIVTRAYLDDRLLPKDSTTYCPSESSCKYDYFDKQPHIFKTGN